MPERDAKFKLVVAGLLLVACVVFVNWSRHLGSSVNELQEWKENRPIHLMQQPDNVQSDNNNKAMIFEVLKQRLLLVSRYQAIVASNEVSPGLADQLKALEDRMKSEIQGLKKKVSDLELELSGLKSQPHTENKRQLPINEQEVAFSARVASHIKGLGTDQTIVFSDVRTNIGNRYNPATGVFHVDVTGTYLLFANILSEPGHSIETEIVVDGSSKLAIYSGGAANFDGPGSNMVILKLTQGQDVWVKVHGHYSTNMAVHCCWSTFSGYLLRPTDSEIDVVG